jgi:hypothetical protein
MMDEMIYLNELVKHPQQEELKELERLLGFEVNKDDTNRD